jgi:hypothetical protein
MQRARPIRPAFVVNKSREEKPEIFLRIFWGVVRRRVPDKERFPFVGKLA